MLGAASSSGVGCLFLSSPCTLSADDISVSDPGDGDDLADAPSASNTMTLEDEAAGLFPVTDCDLTEHFPVLGPLAPIIYKGVF